MKRINSLSDLLMEELSDLLSAENLLVEVLPKMGQVSQLPALKTILEDHLKVTKDQVYRLQDIFSNIRQEPQKITCKTMKRIIADCDAVINKTEKCRAQDTDIISMARRIEQYEIAGYQAACEHAADLGHTRIVELLNETLDEERVMNLRLIELAQYIINAQAINPFAFSQESTQQQEPFSTPDSGGFYMPERKFKRGSTKKKPKSTDVSRFIDEGNPNTQGPQGKGEEPI
jgi:ferritin-like metal-binding protein YciE